MANSDNKRIAKNTMLLYVRMIVMMVISFFTARVTLNALGVTDYGVNNVVGGLVSMFSLLSGSLSSSTSRFLTFGLGEGNMDKLKRIFSTSVNIHVVLAIVVVLAVETLGVWFLNHRMTIPLERMEAANWVLQCSVVVFAIGLFSVPYNSAIIAHEKMSAFAYMTIFDAASRLAIIGGIYFYKGDKLILFALMTMTQSFLRQSIYWIYCKRKFRECEYHFGYDKALTRNMFSFAGWNFIGSTAGLMKDQGVNIAINLFTNPAVNAARGIAMQVDSIIGQFTRGFMTSLNPQITKTYASGDLYRMHKLIYQGTRMSYYLFMFFAVPVFFEIESVLHIWLGQVPEHTILFTRLALVMTLLEILSNMLITAQAATGNIRNYQIVTGGVLLMNFPVSYMLLKFGIFPEATLIVAIVISQICLVVRLYFLRTMVKLSVRTFLERVYFSVIFVTLLTSVPPALCCFLMNPGWIRLIILCMVSVISSLVIILFIGCSHDERVIIKQVAVKYTTKLFHKNQE